MLSKETEAKLFDKFLVTLTNEPITKHDAFNGVAPVEKFSQTRWYEIPMYPYSRIFGVQKNEIKTQDNMFWDMGSWTEREEEFINSIELSSSPRT